MVRSNDHSPEGVMGSILERLTLVERRLARIPSAPGIAHLGHALTTTPAQASIAGTGVAITGMTLTIDLAVVASLRFQGSLQTSSTQVGDILAIRLMEGATRLADHASPANAAPATANTARSQHFGFILDAVPVGAHTYTLQVLRTAGSGTITVSPSTFLPNWFSVDRVA